MERDIERYVKAHYCDFETARDEIASGRKRGHWMWYIFPQIEGLGFSPTSQYYGLQGREEAAEFLAHPMLGRNLRELCEILLTLPTTLTAEDILGPVDALKLRSSMTIFDAVSPSDIFASVLARYYASTPCPQTLERISI